MRHIVAVFVFSVLVSSIAKADTPPHTIYLNDCKPAGCTVHAGNTNSTTDTSSVVGHSGTLTAFSLADSDWADIKTCVATMFAPFDVTVTDVRPTSGDYFEIFIAGSPADLGLSASVGAIGPYQDSVAFIPHDIAFSFPTVYSGANRNFDICNGAVDALSLGFGLDHVVDGTDVKSYNAGNGQRSFHNGETCGSDCVGGHSPLGLTCTGSGGTATHDCFNGTATQDEVTVLTTLFGPAPQAPTVAITSPADGASVQNGFTVDIDCTSSDGVMSVMVDVDGSSPVTVTTAPYATTFTALTTGTHTINATCTTTRDKTATASITITVNGDPTQTGPDGNDTGSGGKKDSGGCNAAGCAPFAALLMTALLNGRFRPLKRTKSS